MFLFDGVLDSLLLHRESNYVSPFTLSKEYYIVLVDQC